MINSDEELSLEYLLSPEFEMINSAGKPLTDGWIEVYIHGTRDKYYCCSDFDGTLHPFQIPLDSLGSNVVLADPNLAYDVYFYNKYGSLIMSRYNVKCQGSGGSGGSTPYIGDRLEYGQYSASNVLDVATLNRTQGNIATTSDGKLKLKEDMSYHITIRGSYVIQDPRNTEATVNFIEPTTLNRIKINVDNTITDPQYFELSYDLFKLQYDTDYAIAFETDNGKIDSLTVEVHSLSNLNTTLTGGQLFDQGWGILIEDNVISVDPTIFNDYVTFNDLTQAVTSVHNEITVETLELVSSVSSVLQNEIDNIQEGVQPDWEQDDDTQPDYIKNKPDLTQYATHDEVIEVVTAVSTVLQNEIDQIPPQEQADWAEDDVDSVRYIRNKPDLDIYATNETVTSVSSTLVEMIDEVSSAIPELPETEEVEFEELDVANLATKDDISELNGVITAVSSTLHTEIVNEHEFTIETVSSVSSVLVEKIDEVSSAIPELPETEEVEFEELDVSNLATKDMLADAVTSVTSVLHEEITEGDITLLETITAVSTVLQNEIDNIPEQVQSDWQEADTESPAYIQNKPDLDIYATHDEVCAVSTVLVERIDEVSSAIPELPETEEVEFEELDVSSLATKGELSVVSGDLYNLVTSVSAAVPDAQVQSDWTETDDTKKSYIQHKPEVKDVYAGENITLTETASGLEISSYGTDTTAVSAIAEAYMEIVTAMIPEAQVQSDWTETDTSDPSYIQNKPTPKTLVAGDGINITDTVTGVEISASVSALPETEEVEFEELDVDSLVTEVELIEAISSVTGTGDYGQFYCNTASGACVMGKIKGTIDVTNDGKIKLEKGKSYHISVRGCYRQSTASNTEDTIGFIEYVTNNTIQINVDRTVTSGQYFDLGFDLYNLSADTDYYVFFTGVSNSGVVQDVFVDVHTILGGGSGGNGGGGGGGTEYNQGWGIVINNNTISVNPNIIPAAQVQSDWSQSNSSSVDFIKNKPSEIGLYGGNNIEIEIVGSSAIISSTGGAGSNYNAGYGISIVNDTISVTGMQQAGDYLTASDLNGYATETYVDEAVSAVSAAIPETEEVEFEELNLADYALATSVPTIELNGDSQVTAIDGHEIYGTGGSFEQVNADWDAVSGVAEILNKPEIVEMDVKGIRAGSNINITETTDNIVIAVTGVAQASAIPSLSGYATETYVQGAVSGKQDILTGITDVQVVQSLPASPTQDVLYLIVEA